jgi:hypothetical protein
VDIHLSQIMAQARIASAVVVEIRRACEVAIGPAG